MCTIINEWVKLCWLSHFFCCERSCFPLERYRRVTCTRLFWHKSHHDYSNWRRWSCEPYRKCLAEPLVTWASASAPITNFLSLKLIISEQQSQQQQHLVKSVSSPDLRITNHSLPGAVPPFIRTCPLPKWCRFHVVSVYCLSAGAWILIQALSKSIPAPQLRPIRIQYCQQLPGCLMSHHVASPNALYLVFVERATLVQLILEYVQQIRMGFTSKQPGACAKLTKVSQQLLLHAGDRLTGLGIKP